jgi:hypothetical protein
MARRRGTTAEGASAGTGLAPSSRGQRPPLAGLAPLAAPFAGLSGGMSMRTLGPGSVSSFLKVVLDVFYAALWVALGALVLGGVAILIFQPLTTGIVNIDVASANTVDIEGVRPATVSDLINKPQALAGLIFIVSAYIGVLIVVLNRLRRVFETLIVGDPFRPQNVARLRVVGFALIALEVLGYVVHRVTDMFFPGRNSGFSLSVNLTGWFAILVVFVLAEVFREGARLRQEADLTI